MSVLITDGNFKQEVEEEKLPVMVDFWAEWCVAPETRIMTSRRGGIVAEKLTRGGSLLSMSDNGIFIDRAEVVKVVNDGGHCKHVITETGREISTTDDHLFFTSGGWKKAEGLVAGDKVAVLPAPENVSETIVNDEVIAAAETVKVAKEMSGMHLEEYIRDLEIKGLLPLRLSSSKLSILARIMGAVFSDGSLYLGRRNNYREISFTLGNKKDVEELTADLRQLGIEKMHVSERRTNNLIQGRKFIAHTFKVKVLSTSLWLLLVALGVPRGRKTDAVYRLPEWLSRASKLVRREFLAAYLGGDGPKVDIRMVKRSKRSTYNGLVINDLEFHKRLDLERSGLDLAGDIAELMESFDVRVARIFSEPEGYKWKNGRQSVIIHIRFKRDVETAYAFANKIGYVYCNQKQRQAEITGEFLARIRRRREAWQQIYAMVQQRAAAGMGVKDIATRLGISAGTVWGWVKQGKKATTNYYKEKFDSWVVEAKRGLQDGFLWDVVGEVKEIFLPAVARITVAANHNFVANGFVVHNCGPCRLAEPVIEELAVKYQGRVKIGKLNVDENSQQALRYGVLSIPTVILFKGGKEVERQVGYAGRAGYERLVEKALGD